MSRVLHTTDKLSAGLRTVHRMRYRIGHIWDQCIASGFAFMAGSLCHQKYTACWDDEELRERAIDNMSKLFAGGSEDPQVPDESNVQLALADDEALLDEGGKLDVGFLVE